MLLLGMMGELHYTDEVHTQHFLSHIALPKEGRVAVVEQAQLLHMYGQRYTYAAIILCVGRQVRTG